MRISRCLIGVLGGFFLSPRLPAEPIAPDSPHPDVIVVGAGIAGLSAALELGRGGAQVLVVDLASVFGGHAVMAHGQLNLVATPYQAAHDIHDSPEIAFKDFIQWGEDADPDWVRYYVEHSKPEIYDWLTSLGVRFDGVVRPAGNSVARVHEVHGRGLGLVAPIYRECLRTKGISFRWSQRLDRLLRAGDRVTGIAVTDERTGHTSEIKAGAVILATGGFQSNLALVRETWPSGLPLPSRVLAGAGINAMGSGLDVARSSGAAVARLDHQWNYLSGLPDPRFPRGDRGLFANVPSVWVNTEGKRFMAENSSPKFGMATLLRQPGGTYWAIFGPNVLASFAVSGSDWADHRKVEELILDNSNVVKKAGSLEALATLVGLPAAELKATVLRFNVLVAQGNDEDFGRFGPGKATKPPMVLGPPYYAAQFFPITRKSLGGLVIDLSARVLDTRRKAIPGLYAAGEITGLAGINGRAGLEGTFLGPSLLTGRVAGRAVLAELEKPAAPPPPNSTPLQFKIVRPSDADNQQCLICHALPSLVAQPRRGFWHFERVHQTVLEKKFSCTDCHGEISGPPAAKSAAHRLDPVSQMLTCATCHQGEPQ